MIDRLSMRWAVLVMLAAVVTAGCNDEDECINCPGPPAAFDRLWPNADGTAWSYALESGFYPGPDAGEDDLPHLNELYADLQRVPAGEHLESQVAGYGLTFRGQVTTDAGVTVQYLEESLVALPTAGGIQPSGSLRLLQTVARARPDLRAELEARYGVRVPASGGKSVPEPFYLPLFLGGYAWEKSNEGIYGYGDLSPRHSWIYLEEDMKPGSGFQMQLVPELANDIFLYGLVWRTFTAEIADTAYPQSSEVLYVVDLGIIDLTDENGNIVSTGRSYAFGVVHYVPGVGPVYCHERSVFAGGMTAYQDPLPGAVIDCRVELIEAVLPD